MGDQRATAQARAFPVHSGVRPVEALGVRLRRRVAARLEQRHTANQPVREATKRSLESVGGSLTARFGSQPLHRPSGRPSKGRRGLRIREHPQRALLTSQATARVSDESVDVVSTNDQGADEHP
jgi:hypothetical protein